MANLDRITRVDVALRSRGIQALSFSDGMIVDVHSAAPRFTWITRPGELLEGSFGLDTDSPLYRAALAWFSQIPHPARLGVGRRGSQELIDEALEEIRKASNQWYGFDVVSHNPNDLIRAAEWAEANEKLFFTVISDIDVLGEGGVGTEPATALMQGNFYRTAWWYARAPDQHPAVAVMSKSFTFLPGRDFYANATLSGVQSVELDEGEYSYVRAKKGNTFEPFRDDVSLTQGGTVAAGEWIDTIRRRDWLAEEIRVTNFQGQIDRYIPYTDQGIGLFRTWTTQALDLAVRRGVLSPPTVDPARPQVLIPSFIVTVPARATISANQVASRVLTDVNFVGRLSGAIHAVDIFGELTYDNIG